MFIFVKKNVFLILLSAIMVTLSYLIVSNDKSILPIKTVKVSGDYTYTSPSLIKDIYKSHINNGFISLNIQKLRNAIMELPWVNSVKINRVWPDSVEILLDENKAFAIWNNTHLITANGSIFSPPAKMDISGLPMIEGSDELKEEIIKKFNTIQNILRPTNNEIASLSFSNINEWNVTLKNNVILKLGSVGIEDRLKKLISKYDKIIGEKIVNIKSIDLRYINGFAIDWNKDKTLV